MHCHVIVASRQGGIGNGLTYDTGSFDVKLGSLVRVSLRGKLIEGIVVGLEKESKPDPDDFDVKPIAELISNEPLLSEAHIQTVKWMANYYYCPLRSALTAFLPAPPWSKLASFLEGPRND